MIESAFPATGGGHLVSFSSDFPTLLLLRREVSGCLGRPAAAHVAPLGRGQAGAAAAVAAGGERARRHMQRRRRARVAIPHRIQDAWNYKRGYSIQSSFLKFNEFLTTRRGLFFSDFDDL